MIDNNKNVINQEYINYHTDRIKRIKALRRTGKELIVEWRLKKNE